MSENRQSYFNIRMIVGLVIVAVGAIALLANFGYDVDIDLFDYWPLILVLIGLSRIFQPPEYRHLWFGLSFTAVGVLFLLDNFGFVRFGFDELWPFILIIVGIAVLRHGFGVRRGNSTDIDYIDHTAILGGGEYRYTAKNLTSGKLFAFMGGCEINLRQADMQGDEMVIDVFTMMGGIEIRVPDNWQVTMRGIPIMGGMSDTTILREAKEGISSTPAAKKLIIKGMAIMGGVEVKN